MSKHVLTLGILLFSTSPTWVHAQLLGPDIPDSLSFQGYLTNLGGVPIDDTVDITFKMYKGESEIWSQTKTDIVVSNGVFDAILGDGILSLNSIPFDRPIEIGISIDGQSEIVPRTPLTPAAYALGVRGHYAVRSGGSPGDVAMNLIGGSFNNYVADNVAGATIGGGGGQSGLPPTGVPDSVTGSWGTVGGGRNNRAGQMATVGGGSANKATAAGSTIGGGGINRATSNWTTISGGNNNEATDEWATIGGGRSNVAGGSDATVGGGSNNVAGQNGSTIGGGSQNQTTGLVSTVAGGNTNFAAGFESTVAGGGRNIAGNTQAVVGGGDTNWAVGIGSTVPGGALNRAVGDYSFTAGYRARAEHEGTFVWSDRSSGEDSLVSTGANQFLIKAAGGVGIGTTSPQNSFHVVRSVSGSASVQNHVGVIDNTSTGTGADVLALRVGRSTAPGNTNAFLTFVYNGNTGAGFIRGNGTGGVELVSSGADYAEYLPHLHPDESLAPGDVVGVFAGAISRKTDGADEIMVVSTSPIIVGNMDLADPESGGRYSKVSFIGQAPVKVRGSVESGDFLIPSGLEDGVAKPIDPAHVTAAQLGSVFATAWESKSDERVGLVNSAIGIDQASAAVAVVEKLQERQAGLIETVQTLTNRVEKLEGQASY